MAVLEQILYIALLLLDTYAFIKHLHVSSINRWQLFVEYYLSLHAHSLH